MLISFALYKYFPYGGLQRDLLSIAKKIQIRGHKVKIYTRSWQGEKPDGIEVLTLPVKAFTNYGLNKEFYCALKKDLKENPTDLLIGFNKMPDLDFYYAADDCFAEVLKNKNPLCRYLPRYKQYLDYENAVAQRGTKTKIMTISPKQKIQFQNHYGTEEERFLALPPGISESRRYKNLPVGAKELIRNSLRIHPEDYVALQIGSDFYRKGVDRSIRAIASLPPKLKQKTHLVILGQDNPEKFLRLASALNIRTQIHFMGGRDDVPMFIAASDIFLHPARSEAAGIAILEALVGGLPQIVTETCGYSQYINLAKSGIVIPEPFSQELFNSSLKNSLNEKMLSKWRTQSCLFSDTRDLYSLTDKAADYILNS